MSGVKSSRLSASLLSVFIAISILAVAIQADASIISLNNASFENNLTGWNVYSTGAGTASVVNTWTDGSTTYNPKDGNSFLKLTAGSNSSIGVFQNFSAKMGDTLSGWAGLASSDQNLKDAAYVLSISMTNYIGQVIWYKEGSTNGWQLWPTWTAPADGTYRLQYSLQNGGTLPSTAVVDAVPIPASILLLGSGLIGLLLVRRRRR